MKPEGLMDFMTANSKNTEIAEYIFKKIRNKYAVMFMSRHLAPSIIIRKCSKNQMGKSVIAEMYSNLSTDIDA